MTNFIAPAVNAVKQWASLSGSDAASPERTSARQAKIPFAKAYPKVDSPVKLSEGIRDSVIARVGLYNIGASEVDLALSRIADDINHSQLSAKIQEVISAFRAEHPVSSEEAARRELLEGSKALSEIDSRFESARLALAQSEADQKELERAFHEFRSLPARVEQLQNKAASLKAQRKELVEIDFDKKISQLLELEYSPKVGVTIHGSVPALLMIKETLPLRLAVIDGLVAQIEEELSKLKADNARLAKQLDLPAHKV